MISSSSSSPSSSDLLFVGIDVAKDKLDVARSESTAVLTVANDAAGIRGIVKTLAAQRPQCIVVEGTGGLEQPLLDALLDAGLPVARVNPAHVRHFAKGLGILAKTDRIDARVLVQFARLAEPRLAEKRPQLQAQLDSLVTCRRQLVVTRAVQMNQLQRTGFKPAAKAIQSIIDALNKQIVSLDEQIRKLIDSDIDFKKIDELLKTVPGVGPVSSSTLVAELSELGTIDRRQIGALIGVVPFNNDSGRHKGTRSIRGGRASVRSALYMAALTAIRCNPIIKTFAKRLRANGKKSKQVIVACMRKLATILNAMIRDNLKWDELKLTATT